LLAAIYHCSAGGIAAKFWDKITLEFKICFSRASNDKMLT